MPRTFDPFREMDRLFNEVNRTPNGVAMPMDLYREGDVFVARIDLPGVDPSSIDVDVEERTLTVRAERPAQEAPEASTQGGDSAQGGGSGPGGAGRQWLTRERASGTFARQLSLGQGLALDKISAEYSDGVLTLVIPVAEQSKPRKIQVSHVTSGASNRQVTQQGEEHQVVSGSVEEQESPEKDASK